MNIGLIYSRKDPQQTMTRDFLLSFIKERGVLANLVETDEDVLSPTVIIDGRELKELRRKPRGRESTMYPTIKDIAEALERHVWSL